MRKFILIALLISFAFPLFPVTFEIGEDVLAIRDRNFSYDFTSNLLFFRGRYLAYGRLDSLSVYSSLFNPYRRYHHTGLSVSDSATRGIRGFLLKFQPISISLSISEEMSTAFSYDGKYMDVALVYYNERKEGMKSIIHSYKREDKRDVLSLLLRGRYHDYVDLMTIISYSPYLGLDGFYRVDLSYENLSVRVKYGNTFLSDNDGLFSIETSLESSCLDFRYSILYDEASVYTDFFRSYRSEYVTTFKINGFRLRHLMEYEFKRNAERERLDRFSISYKGLYASYDNKGRIYFRLRHLLFEMGIAENGPFFYYRITENIELCYEGGKMSLRLRLIL